MAHNSLPLLTIVANRSNFPTADLRFYLINSNMRRVVRALHLTPAHPALVGPRTAYAAAHAAAQTATAVRPAPGMWGSEDEDLADAVERLLEALYEAENALADAEIEEALADAEMLQQDLEKRG